MTRAPTHNDKENKNCIFSLLNSFSSLNVSHKLQVLKSAVHLGVTITILAFQISGFGVPIMSFPLTPLGKEERFQLLLNNGVKKEIFLSFSFYYWQLFEMFK